MSSIINIPPIAARLRLWVGEVSAPAVPAPWRLRQNRRHQGLTAGLSRTATAVRDRPHPLRPSPPSSTGEGMRGTGVDVWVKLFS